MEHLLGPTTRDRSDAFVDRIEVQWDQRGWGLWAVEVPGVDPFIGYIGLWPADDVIGRPAVEVDGPWPDRMGATGMRPKVRAMPCATDSR